MATTINYTLGARGRARIPAVDLRRDTANAFRFDTDDPISVLDETGAITLFTGYALQVTDTPIVEPNGGVESVAEAVDVTRNFDFAIIPATTYPSGTVMRDIVDDIVSYVSYAGVTRDLSMATGPALDGFTIDYASATEALNELSKVTGYPWRLTPSLVLEMAAPGTWTAAFSLTSSNLKIYGGIEWTKSKKQKVNKVFVTFGGEHQVEKTQSFTATASQTTFPLTYPAAGSNLRGYITVNGAFTPLGTAPWSWNMGSNSIEHATGASAGTTVDVKYDAQFPIVTSQGNGSYAAEPLAVRHFAPDIYDLDEANQLADALLTRYEAAPRVVRIKTRAGFEMPGTVLTIDVPERDLPSATWLITAVDIRSTADQKFEYTYTCAEGTQAVDSWVDSFKQMLGASKSGLNAGTVSGALLPGGTGRFESEVIAFSGANVTNQRESRLSNHSNASIEGPAVVLGTYNSAKSVAVVADHLAANRIGVYFVPVAESGSRRFMARIAEDDAGTSGTYYFVTNGGSSNVLNIGAPTAVYGSGYRVNLYASVSDVLDHIRVGTSVAGTTGQVVLAHGASYATVNAAGSTVLSLLAVDSSNRTTLNLNSLALMLANASTSATAGAVSTYLNVRLGGTDYKIALLAP